MSSGMDILNRASCIHQCPRILLKRGTDYERGLDREHPRQQMNQFRRTVADEDHVRIDTTMLRQRSPELPTIGIWIVHDLHERRADRSEHRCGRTERVDAGAKIHDSFNGNPLFAGNLVHIPAMSGLRHPLTIRSHPIPKSTPKRLVQIMSVSALPMWSLVRG